MRKREKAQQIKSHIMKVNLIIQLLILLSIVVTDTKASNINIEQKNNHKIDFNSILEYKQSNNALLDNSVPLNYTNTQKIMIRAASIFAGALIGTAGGMYLGGKLACEDSTEPETPDNGEGVDHGCIVVAVVSGLIIGLPLGITGGIHLSTYIISKDEGATLTFEYRY